MIVNKTANPIYPIPIIKPTAIAKNIDAISFAVPGVERNLIKEKAPATATPAPIFPFTIIITTQTSAGNIDKVIVKLLVVLFLHA